MKPDSMDAVFQALSCAARRRMLDIIQSLPGCSVNDVVKYFGMSRIGVLKHLQTLEAANLVSSRKQGRVRELFFNPVPIQMIYDRWTTEYSRLWSSHATNIKYQAELAQQSKRPARQRRSKSTIRKGK